MLVSSPFWAEGRAGADVGCAEFLKVRKVPLRKFEYSGTLSDADEANKLAAEFRTTVLTDRDLHERVSQASGRREERS